MALIDEGETDWKVIAIDVKDPLSDKLNGKKICNNPLSYQIDLCR